MSERNIFLLQPFEHQQICKHTWKTGYRRSAYSGGYCLFWMMHTTLSIIQLYESPIRANKTPYCQETIQPIGVPSYTTMEMYVLITMTHHISNIFLVGLCQQLCFVRFAKYSPFDFTALCSDAFAVSVQQLYLKIVIQTHYITFQDINLQPYFKITCVKSVLWPVLNSNVVDVSLSGVSLGYWTACNNFKRHCTLPYCVRGARCLGWVLESS